MENDPRGIFGIYDPSGGSGLPWSKSWNIYQSPLNRMGAYNGGHWQAGQAFSFGPAQTSGAGDYRTSTYLLAAQQSAQSNAWTSAGAAISAWSSSRQSIPKTPPIEDAGIRAGEVIAWRVWIVDDYLPCDPALRSVSTATWWHPGKPVTLDDGPWPELRLRPCGGGGVHAWKELRSALEYAACCVPSVVGQIELWGEIIEHEKGYRAEYGYIKSLDYIVPRLNLGKPLEPSRWRKFRRIPVIGWGKQGKALRLLDQLREKYVIDPAPLDLGEEV